MERRHCTSIQQKLRLMQNSKCKGMLQGYDGDQMHIDLNVYSGSMDEFRKQFGLAEKGDRE